ncbi:MAG: TIGR02099 family protein, partial [Pseudomonadota bacterium]|nr:TIGR02099 family protein [Pseudomonadota bacterium]
VNPQGIVTDIGAKWDGPLDAPERYRVKGQLSGLALASRASAEAHEIGRPGLRNAAVQLDATETGGDARIVIDAGAVDLPGVFADPVVPLDRFSAHLLWQIEPPKIAGSAPRLSVQLRESRFVNADARGEMAGTWSSGDPADTAHGGRVPGRLELDGKLASGLANRIARYLPLGFPEAARHYVEGAVRAGTVKGVSFRVKGQLSDFPFANARSAKDGEFRIAAQAEDVTFAFSPDTPQWSALTHLAGELLIDRSALEFRNTRAQLGGVEWTRVHGSIPNLGERPVLSLDASARAPLAEMLKVVNTTPIGGWTGQSLANANATGPAELKLTLAIPLGSVESAAVKGSLALPGNDVRISADTPLLAAAKGRVDFTEKGFMVVGASARVFGGEASFDGGTQSDNSIRFTGQGTATADGLRREPGPLAQVGAALSGQAAYRLNLGFVHGRSQLLVASNLVGLAIDLPYPLAKPAAAALEMRYQTAAVDDPSAAPQTSRDNLRFELGNVLQAHYLREQTADVSRVVRGGIGVFNPAPVPVAGVAANISLQRVDVDAWQAAFEKLSGPSPGALPSASATPTPTANSHATTHHGGASYAPDSIALRAQELLSGSRRLTNVVVGASEGAGGLWRTNLSADQLDGYVEYRPPGGGQGPIPGAGRVFARLSRLSVPKGDVEPVETLLDQQTTSSVPALDIVVDDFELRGKRFGRVEIEAANRTTREPGHEAVREWRLSKLNVSLPEARLTATGVWSGSGGAPGARGVTAKRHSTLDFKLAVDDSGALLERLGVGKAIRGGKGELSGQITWAGSPLALDYPSLSGQVNVAIESGQFLKAEPGAARLLSVLSLQSLPRRLAFDFRDLFEQGFAFDSVTGDMTIAEGVASTSNLRMRGPAAVVLMEGSADIAKETEDLRVVVVPEINAGTASLAFAIINPAVGIGTFLAQYFLRKPLIEAGTREFHVSGPWDDPKVERVERKRTQDVSSADSPAAPASAPNQ